MRAIIQVSVAILALALTAIVRADSVTLRVLDSRGNPVADAVVIAEPAGSDAATTSHAQARAGTARIVQQFQQFKPSILAIRAGTTVEFPNLDRMRHHVYSFSEARRFEIRLYSGEKVPTVTFDRPGVVVIGCNIHDWMEAYIYVSNARYFSTTNQRGRASFDDLPGNSMQFRIWHPSLVEEARLHRSMQQGATATVRLDQPIDPPSQERPENELFARFRQPAE